MLKDSLKEQINDFAGFDVVKNLPFIKQQQPVQISEKEFVTIYTDEKGNIVDAKKQAEAKPY